MFEIKLNFKISLDWFELANFDTNYGLQAVNETVTSCSVFCPIGGEAHS